MDVQELRQVITQAARESRAELDLSGQGLTELPPEIGELTSPQSLYLHGNRLTALPPRVKWDLGPLVDP
jgi:internalin A